MKKDGFYLLHCLSLTKESPVVQLREALQAVEELEQRGVSLEDAWRNAEDWRRLMMASMLVQSADGILGEHACSDNLAKWRERRKRRASIRVVK